MSDVINNRNMNMMAAAAGGEVAGGAGGATQTPVEIVINIDGKEAMRKVVSDELGIAGGGSIVENLRLGL
jgi:hypothetical protein